MKKLIYLFVIMAIAFVSCNKNENDVSEKLTKIDPDALYAKTQYNLDMRDFAMAVNEAVNTNKSFRKFIKDEANKKFDGDFDILLSNVLEKQISHNDVDNGMNTPNKAKANFTVKNLLEDAFCVLDKNNKLVSNRAKVAVKQINSRQNAASNSQSLIDELTSEYPNLQISVPVHVEDLEDESYIPPVAFIPEEYDEKTTDGVKKNIAGVIDVSADAAISTKFRFSSPEDCGTSDLFFYDPSEQTIRFEKDKFWCEITIGE